MSSSLEPSIEVIDYRRRLCGWTWLMPLVLTATTTFGAEIKLLKSRPDDTYGIPRPAFDQQAVPLGTTFYFELAVTGGADDDVVLGESVEVRLQPNRHPASLILGNDVRFAPGYHGFIQPGVDRKHAQKVIVFIDSRRKLLPAANYTILVTARSRDGVELPPDAGTWRFTTRGGNGIYPVDFVLELDAPSVRWQGGFFTGFCGVTFGGNHANRTSTFELMEQVRQTAPRAWSLQRDFWMTGMEHQPEMLAILPNIVRERETRRITAVTRQATETVLNVEDFFGHQQYGISSGRPPSGDYHPGDEVLIADVARRQLQRAAQDARFGLGESILTYWPGPNQNFGGPNDFVREIHVDDDGDGKKDRSVTVAMPVLHLLGLMAQLGNEYHVLPERTIEGHVVSGFASREGDTVRVLLYSHNGLDTESRSDALFDVAVNLGGFKSQSALVREYRFDRDHNSYFRLARSLRDALDSRDAAPDARTMEKIQTAIDMLKRDSTEERLAGLRQLAQFGPKAKSALAAIYQCVKNAQSDRILAEAISAVGRIKLPKAYPADAVREVQRLSRLRETSSAQHTIGATGRLELHARVAANGVNFLTIEPTLDSIPRVNNTHQEQE